MTDQMKVQAAVEVSTENAESALKRVGDAAGQMAERMQREGIKAGEAVDGIGSGASKSADEFSRAEGRIAASIKRATTNLELLGKSASQKLEFKIEERGLDKAKFDPLLSKLRELELRSQEAGNAASASLGKVGVSAAQTAAALRGVPAQFTDIATSIAGGQAPLTVFLQQGGQLKDMFGGAGAAAKALGGYVVGLLTPLNLAVAAIGGIGYAAYAGASEMDEFRKNLILTGSTTGLTVDKFNQLTAALDGLDGVTRGGAAEALTAMAASGNISADAIERLTASALKLERAGGPAVAETVKQFEALGKAPVDASLKLNETTRYLTTAVYEQIKALEDQGKTSEAAAVAQKAWADAIDQRTPKMVENLGHIETAWKGVKEAVAEAIDAAKDWGRVATPSERAAELHTQIGEIEKQLSDPSTVLNRNRLKQDKQSLIAELQGLYAEIRKTHKEESEKTAAESREQQKLAANVRWDKLAESQRSKREQYAQERKKLDADRAADLISEEKYQQAKVALQKKYEERERAAPKARKSDAEREAEREAARMAKLDADEEARRVASIQRTAAAMAKETDAIWSRVEAEIEAAATIGMSKTAIEERTLARMQEQLAWRESLGLLDEETEQIKRNIAAQKVLVSASGETASKQQAAETAKSALDAQRKAAEDAAREWQKTVDTIDGTFHDAFTDMLKQGEADWESFTDSLATTFKSAVADEIYKMTLKPLVLNVVGSFSGAGAPAVPGADGQPAALSNGFGMLSGAQALWGGINGGIANAANSFAMSGFGQAAGLSTTAAMGPPTAAGVMGGPATVMTGAGATFAAAAAPVLGALTAAYTIAEMQKSGWGSDNNAKNYAKDFALFGGTAGVVVLDRLFGHNRNVSNDAQGITGTFDLSGFTGQNYQEKSQKGGTFRSDRRWTDYGTIASDMDKALDSMLKQAVAGVQTIGKALNVETENALQDFSHTFALQLSENGDMSKAGEKIAAELKKVQDELATRLVPNIADFARYGETASDTFDRLNQEVTATDAILLAMGKDASTAFGAVGLASIKAREDLIDLAGGLDKLAGKTQAFYQAYYSSSEQQQLAAKQAQQVLVTGFADIGQSIPANRKAFRDLVEAQDLSTEAGRKLWNSLLDLADEFDTVQKLADASAAALTAAKQSQATLFDTFATDAQKLEAAQTLVKNTFSDIGQSIPESASAFLALSQSIDPATEAGQGLIAALAKVSSAFAYVATASDAAARATLGAKAGKIEGDMQSLVDRFGSLSPVARTVADDLAATQQQLAGLSDGLASLFNTAQLTDLQKLGQTVGYRDQIRGAIATLNDDIFEAMLKGMSRPQQIDALKKAEADLWSGMGGAADKGAQASKIRAIVLRRLGLESEGATAEANKAADLAKQARQDQIDLLRTQIDGMQRLRDLASEIADFTGNLAVGDLSPLSLDAQLAAAKSLFDETFSKARGGDAEAQRNLTGNARTYLDEARSYYAGSADYAAIFNAVDTQLKSFTAPGDTAINSAQAQLDTLQKLPEVMATVINTSQSEVETLRAVQSALKSGDQYLSRSIDEQKAAMEKQIAALQSLAENQQAQITQAGAAYNAMLDELRQVKAKLSAIENNGALVGAGA